MSLPIPILLTLTPGPGKARMRLECEWEPGGLRLFVREGGERWAMVPPGAPPGAEAELLTREEAIGAALLAGFSLKEVERAVRRPKPPDE